MARTKPNGAGCTRDDKVRKSQETVPKTDPELRRYREAGASGAALLRFPTGDVGSDAFFCVGNFRKTRYRGLAVNQLAAHMLGAAYNLLRIAKLTQTTA